MGRSPENPAEFTRIRSVRPCPHRAHQPELLFVCVRARVRASAVVRCHASDCVRLSAACCVFETCHTRHSCQHHLLSLASQHGCTLSMICSCYVHPLVARAAMTRSRPPSSRASPSTTWARTACRSERNAARTLPRVRVRIARVRAAACDACSNGCAARDQVHARACVCRHIRRVQTAVFEERVFARLHFAHGRASFGESISRYEHVTAAAGTTRTCATSGRRSCPRRPTRGTRHAPARAPAGVILHALSFTLCCFLSRRGPARCALFKIVRTFPLCVVLLSPR